MAADKQKTAVRLVRVDAESASRRIDNFLLSELKGLPRARIYRMIRKGEVHSLKALMSKSNEVGMQTFDQHLYEMYRNGEITYEDAIAHADSANDLRLMIKLGTRSNAELLEEAADNLSLEEDEPEDRGMMIRR